MHTAVNVPPRRDGHPPRLSKRPDRASGLAIAGLLVFVGGLAALAALVPVGHGFAPKGGGWFIPAVVGGVFTLHPLLIAVPWAACFVFGLVDLRNPWRVEQLDLLALAGFFPVAMLLTDDAAQAGLWLAAACLGWLLLRMLGVALGIWRMPELRPSVSSRRLRQAILLLLLVRLASLVGGDIMDVGQASSLGAWRLLHGLHLCIWTYLPHAALVARPILGAALVLLALSPLFRPPVQDVREHAALAAALLIGAQLLLGYWFYSYLTWCYPLLIIAIIRAGPDHGTGPRDRIQLVVMAREAGLV
jgi:hypothetical protein